MGRARLPTFSEQTEHLQQRLVVLLPQRARIDGRVELHLENEGGLPTLFHLSMTTMKWWKYLKTTKIHLLARHAKGRVLPGLCIHR